MVFSSFGISLVNKKRVPIQDLTEHSWEAGLAEIEHGMWD